MICDRVGDEIVVRLSLEEAGQIRQQMVIRKIMGNLVGGVDPLENIGIAVAITLEKSQTQKKPRKKK